MGIKVNHNFTPEDQQQLDELMEKKRLHDSKKRAEVQNVLDKFYFREMSLDELTHDCIANAYDLIQALKPFLKEH